jgi:hypothetical protein
MKKMLTIAAALFVAVAANAATLNWGTSWLYDGDGNDAAAGSAWLVAVGGTLGDIQVDLSGNLILGTGNSLLSSAGISEGSLTGASGYSAAAESLNGVTFVLVAFASATTTYGVSGTWLGAGFSDDPAPNSILKTFGTSGSEMTLNIEAVPEPTSFALLGLGAAALALRRRIRKA